MHNTHADIALIGAPAILIAADWFHKILEQPSPMLQNLAYLAAIIGALVGIYYKVKNKGKD